MDGTALLGILAILYAVAVVYIANTKPEQIWKMKKIQGIKKRLGENGTVIFLFAWAVLFAVIGITLLTK
jgi:hypothetical protein